MERLDIPAAVLARAASSALAIDADSNSREIEASREGILENSAVFTTEVRRPCSDSGSEEEHVCDECRSKNSSGDSSRIASPG